MRLDNMILTDFAAAVISPTDGQGEQTTRATVISVDETDDKNVTIVIDGSHENTAATTVVKCEADDRVMVLLKGHKATVIGNISSPVLRKVTANDIVAGAVTADAITTHNIEGTYGWINLHNGTFNFSEKLIWGIPDGETDPVLTVRGKLTANSGSQIGPWTIESDCIWYGNQNYGNANGLYFGTSGLSLTDKFKVSAAGVLNATGASISGTLTAGANSKIGPWTVTDTSIYKTSSAWGNATAGAAYFGNYGISITDKFKVDAAGALTSTSGSIGGWNIGTDTLYAESTSTAGTATYRKINMSSSPYASLDGIRLEERATSASGNLRHRTIIDFTGISMRDNVNDIDGSFSASRLMISGNGGTNISYMDKDTISTTGTFKEGGTALSSKYLAIRPVSIEFNPPATAGHGGYIDFHFNGSTADCTSRIIESSSGTLSIVGALTTSSTIIANYNGAMIRATNPKHGNLYAGLHTASNGLHGIYSNGYWNGSALTGSGRWLIYRNTANNTCVESELFTHNEGYTTFRPVVGTNAGTNAVGVIVSNSATFGIYGRWAGGATAAMSGRTISCPGSDIRLKENVEDSTIDALSVINAIKIRQFDWKDKSRGHWDCGMVVDEMEKDVDPKFCIGGGEDEDGNISYKCVDTFYLQGYEVKAIQELSARVEELERRLNEQRN